jgi:lactate dehydrogenase-like 2-hydroxyacid dehydrogenase
MSRDLARDDEATAYLINTTRGTARGALVDEAALADALRVHRIAGAGMTRTAKSRRWVRRC